MKKFLATILSVILLLTIIPMAYARSEIGYKRGDIVQFGTYPQSEVKDEALIAELNALAPEWDEWISYGYYSGAGGIGVYYDETRWQGDWMRYTDVMYKGNKYRGVKFTRYRPTYTKFSSSYTHQDDNGYSTNTAYWFKFAPIDWRVLDPSTGFVMCETIIDSQPYSNTVYKNSSASVSEYAFFNDASYTNYASDYETSSIRKWLNEEFYNTAFTDTEKKEINTTTLNNDGYYTSIGTTGYEALDSNSTNDKIFLLSYNEVRNSNLGFDSSVSAYDKARFAQGSDYAQSQGLYVYRDNNYNSFWFLRSPGHYSLACCGVCPLGTSKYSYGCDADYTGYGIRPALRLNWITEHKCDYTSTITTPATHIKEGVKTFTCECGDTYTESIPKLEGHTYSSKITTEPTHIIVGIKTFTCECGDSYTEEIAKLEGHSYTSEIITKPTHTTVGVKIFTCECGDSYTEEITKLESHTYDKAVTAPTCTTQGYTTYTCECGNAYIEPIAPTGHDFDGSKCKNCGFDKAENCSCNCHKGGFMGFFWKIINFFNKLFKSKQYCGCGAKHW